MSSTPNVIVNRVDKPAPRESWWKYLLRLAGITAWCVTVGAITLAVWSVLLGNVLLGSLAGFQTDSGPTSDQGVTLEIEDPENDAQGRGALDLGGRLADTQ